MIRVRSADGTAIEIEAGKTIEVCSSDGKVGRVIFWNGHQVVSMGPEDPEFHVYCRAVKAPLAEVVAMQDS